MLVDIMLGEHVQGDLLETPNYQRSDALMNLVDGLNSRMGRDTTFDLQRRESERTGICASSGERHGIRPGWPSRRVGALSRHINNWH